jgi:hypothetical protein
LRNGKYLLAASVGKVGVDGWLGGKGEKAQTDFRKGISGIGIRRGRVEGGI